MADAILAREVPEPSRLEEVTAGVIIPALDEERTVGRTLSQLPAGLFATAVVVDNGSQDRTAEVAAANGARVVREPRRGYGAACLAGIAALDPSIEIVAFLDADGSDSPGEAKLLLAPILSGEADLVIGSRELGRLQAGALRTHQRWGNRLVVTLVRLMFGFQYSDLGPFRAIRRDSLEALDMRDRGYGWTIEMQVKALRSGLRVREVPVSYGVRAAGESKISGRAWQSILAGAKILWTVARLRLA